MRISLIKKQTIQNFIRHNSPAKRSFEIWLTTIKYADWSSPEDIMKTFGAVDFLGRGTDRIVFNIGGNNYRLIAKYYFGKFKVHLFVKWIGTHAGYDTLCSKGRQYTVDDH